MRWSPVNLALLFVSFVLFMAVAVTVWADEIIASSAMSLKGPFQEIGRIFEERNPGTRVIFNFGASGGLAKQIEEGAPVDVFASADERNMDRLQKLGLILEDSRKNFAGNTVVLISPSSDSRVQTFHDLAKSGIKRIAIGNPSTSPAGKYAEETMKNLGLWENLRERLVFAENVRQILDYVARGEADAGMLYITDAFTSPEAVRIAAGAPRNSHAPVVYPIAVIKGSKQETLARKFAAFVLSADSAKILEKFGFIRVK